MVLFDGALPVARSSKQ